MKTCKKCVLNERFPGIRFNTDGICNFCLAARDAKQLHAMKDKCEKKFRQLIQECQSDGSYDCLVAYSGGKDSTYTLHLLKKKYGLRCLAFSFDNWFQSHAAESNITAVLNNINIDHWTVKPAFQTMKHVIIASMSRDVYSRKALSRASAICTSCISLVRFIGLRIAIEEEIPFLVFGMSPGQAPIATSVVKTNPRVVRSMQETLLRPLWENLGSTISPFFLEERHFQNVGHFPYSVNPLAFEDYDETRILEVVQGYGWTRPEDTDANSTNCLLNAFANQVHLDQFGVNPYAYEIAELVRNGYLSREEGLRRLEQPVETGQIDEVKRRLGLE